MSFLDRIKDVFSLDRLTKKALNTSTEDFGNLYEWLPDELRIDKPDEEENDEGLIIWGINNLPGPIHIPNYNYCGPGTEQSPEKFKHVWGINPLDEACKYHDLEYIHNKSIEARNIADLDLARRAWEQSNAPDATPSERRYAKMIATIMWWKSKSGN